MSDYEYYEDVGWDVDSMSCYCPQRFSPCSPQQVEQDRIHWIKDVSPWSQLSSALIGFSLQLFQALPQSPENNMLDIGLETHKHGGTGCWNATLQWREKDQLVCFDAYTLSQAAYAAIGTTYSR